MADRNVNIPLFLPNQPLTEKPRDSYDLELVPRSTFKHRDQALAAVKKRPRVKGRKILGTQHTARFWVWRVAKR